MSRLSKTITVLTLVFTLGLQWSLLQSLAWVTMVIRYSRSASYGAALVRTFDGEHPCSICYLVADGQKAEQQRHQESRVKFEKLELVCARPDAFLFLESEPDLAGTPTPAACGRFEEPPSPPPRRGPDAAGFIAHDCDFAAVIGRDIAPGGRGPAAGSAPAPSTSSPDGKFRTPPICAPTAG